MFSTRYLFLLFIMPICVRAQTASDTSKTENWTLHFQQTVVGQYHPDFTSPYSGLNSQNAKDEPTCVTITSTIFLGRRLWQGGELYFNPELSGGQGVGHTLGIAGFPNGESYRVGTTLPVIAMVRLFIRQTIDLGTKRTDKIEDGVNQLPGYVPDKRLVFTAGKFSVTDIFDANSYSHDPRSQFLNWSIMSAGAWDYPADTKGYTWGAVGELFYPGWSLKAGITMVPSYANGPVFDDNVTKANSVSVEYDKNFKTFKRPGVLRIIGFYTNAHMGNYAEATNDSQYHHDITQTRAYGRTKEGFVVNAEQEISDNAGLFARWSYNDGKNESWAFTEIDGSVTAGVSFKGTKWKRPDDVLGIAFVVNGLSKDHEAYLAAGGYGFLIGDGKINYGNESILETYYNIKWGKYLFLSPDYQFVLNPAYNKDRGPINLFALRAHVEF
jgi:high affinity Mn2+ porin